MKAPKSPKKEKKKDEAEVNFLVHVVSYLQLTQIIRLPLLQSPKRQLKKLQLNLWLRQLRQKNRWLSLPRKCKCYDD